MYHYLHHHAIIQQKWDPFVSLPAPGVTTKLVGRNRQMGGVYGTAEGGMDGGLATVTLMFTDFGSVRSCLDREKKIAD